MNNSHLYTKRSHLPERVKPLGNLPDRSFLMSVTFLIPIYDCRRYPVHPAAGSTPVPSPAPRPPLPVCAQSRPRDDPGVPRLRGLRAGGRQTAPPRRAA
eukprot:4013810-Prymnesium_polylepis.1